jgi:hypothetical protein
MDGELAAPPAGYALPLETPWSYLKNRANFFPRSLILEACVRASLRVPGNIIEFGVASGASTRVIRRTLREYGSPWFVPFGRKKIFALDSFQGLREKFENAEIGTFAGEVPQLPLRPDRSRLAWKISYYLGRLGFDERKNWIDGRM